MIIVRLALVSLIVVVLIRAAQTSYSYGYRVFAQEPVSTVENARTVTITYSPTDSVKDLAERLEEKGLIEDAMLFLIQEMVSDYHGKLNPGIYELSTAMTAEQMLQRMSADASTGADSAPEASPAAPVEGAGGTGEEGSWEGEEGSMGENPADTEVTPVTDEEAPVEGEETGDGGE